MGMKTSEVGGGAATGLSDNFINMLQSLLNGGGIGAAGSPNPVGTTGNVMSVLQDILGAGGGRMGNSIDQMLSKQADRDVMNLRSRFGASGGTAFGTPGAFAESLYRSEAAPRVTSAIGQLQLQALAPIFSAATNLSPLGIAQRQIIQQKSGLGQAMDVLGGLAQTALPFVMPGLGAGAALASMPAVSSFTGANFTPPSMQPVDWRDSYTGN